MALANILNKLKGVRGGQGVFSSFCPIHQDYSLTVRELDGGIIKISCKNECCTHDILKKLELTARDVYPPQYFFQEPKKAYPPHVYQQVLLDLIQDDRKSGKTISKQDLAIEREVFMALRKAS